jgi:alanyl-tRNA synthetase
VKDTFLGEQIFVGNTMDGKPLFNGALAFKMKATYGLPLEYTFDLLNKRNMVIDWAGYVAKARSEGQSQKSITAQIRECFLGVYSKEEIEANMTKVERLLEIF